MLLLDDPRGEPGIGHDLLGRYPKGIHRVLEPRVDRKPLAGEAGGGLSRFRDSDHHHVEDITVCSPLS